MIKTRKFTLAIVVLFLLTLFTYPSVPLFAEKATNGSLVIVGGGLDPNNAAIYNRIIQLAGGVEKAKIAILPTANSNPSYSGNAYKNDFINYGVPKENITIIPIVVKDDKDTEGVDESTWKENALKNDVAANIRQHNIVFFTGGSQLRITDALIQDGKETPALKAIRSIYAKGGIISGSSAGAAIMSDPMIGAGTSLGALSQGVTFKDNYFDPEDNRVFLTQGLGFFSQGIIDQHFVKRGRLGRLIRACVHQKLDLGIGIDENTAAIITGDTMQVLGENGVIVVDLANAKVTNTDNFSMKGIRVSYLETGDGFNMEDKTFSINPAKDLSLIGDEYYEGNTLNTNVFGPDAIMDLMTTELVDNTATESIGITFNLDSKNKGQGLKLIFSETDETEGYWGKVDGINSYAAINVNLDFIPITITIEEKK